MNKKIIFNISFTLSLGMLMVITMASPLTVLATEIEPTDQKPIMSQIMKWNEKISDYTLTTQLKINNIPSMNLDGYTALININSKYSNELFYLANGESKMTLHNLHKKGETLSFEYYNGTLALNIIELENKRLGSDYNFQIFLGNSTNFSDRFVQGYTAGFIDIILDQNQIN